MDKVAGADRSIGIVMTENRRDAYMERRKCIQCL